MDREGGDNWVVSGLAGITGHGRTRSRGEFPGLLRRKGKALKLITRPYVVFFITGQCDIYR